MWRKRSNAGLSLIEILVVIVCVIAIFFLVRLSLNGGQPYDEARKVRCASNLRCIATAMNIYIYKFGDNKFYPVLAGSFRGDCWLATVCWKGAIMPCEFICPGSDDDMRLPPETRPADLSLASAIPDKAMSYAGRCHGLKGKYAHRNTADFSESALCPSDSNASVPLACDKNRKKQNHADGMNVVYFDSHVEFIAGDRADTYDLIGAPGSKFEKLDGGEE